MRKKALFISVLLTLAASALLNAQVKFPEYIEHYDLTKALVDQEQIRGTHWSVIDKTARNNIPSDKREIGMLVTWIESSAYVTKRFEGANTTNAVWQNDLNWVTIVNENDTISYANLAFTALEADTADAVRNIRNIDSLSFKTIDADAIHNEGALKYDSTTHSLQFQNDITGFNHNLGYELVVRVRNNSGALIANGKVVTLAGIYVNGYRAPTIKLAQIDSAENLNPIGITTVDIPNNSYGIVTLFGEIKGINTSGFPEGADLWVDSDGGLRLDAPEPPEYALKIGFCFYADAVNGSVYIQPQPIMLAPTPHFFADTSNVTQSVTITSADTYYNLPVSLSQTRTSIGFIVAGDSVQILTTGHYVLGMGLSFGGNPSSEVWRYGFFTNGIPGYTKSISTSSSAISDVSVQGHKFLAKGDWVSYRIKNESGTGDPTIIDMNFNIILIHEE